MNNDSLSSRPIGVFDSGVGGFSVLQQLLKDYPHESFIYLGDTARLPYGTKSSKTIIKYAKKNLDYLLKKFNIKALVVACNSVSSVIEQIESPVPIFGVIKPGAKAAFEAKKNKESIGLWATQATVLSKAYQKEIEVLEDGLSIEMVSCPTLVSLVEEGLDSHPLLPEAFNFYFEKFNKPVDILILGCTHFPFFKKRLNELYPKLKLIDSSIQLSKSLKENLPKELFSKDGTQKVKLLLTDEAESFKLFINRVLKKPVEVYKVDL